VFVECGLVGLGPFMRTISRAEKLRSDGGTASPERRNTTLQQCATPIRPNGSRVDLFAPELK